MKYKSIAFILLCCFFFIGKSNCVVAKTTDPQCETKQNTSWNRIKSSTAYKLNKFLNKRYVENTLIISLSVATTVACYFAGQKLGGTGIGESIKNTITSSKIATTSYIVLGQLLAGLPGASLITGIIS